MIDDNILKMLETAYNSKPCKFCGLTHKVIIKQVHSYNKAICYQADATIPRGDMTIIINLDDNACFAAQTEVTMLVSEKTAGM